MKLPSVLVKNVIVGNGYIFGGTADWAVYIGKQPAEPDRVITVYDSGGLAADPKWLVHYPSVQIRVRGNPSDYENAGSKAQEMYNLLVGIDPQVVDGDRIDGITAIGDVAFLGWDDRTRPEFVLNLRMIVEPTVSTSTDREPL